MIRSIISNRFIKGGKMKRLQSSFFERDVIDVAPALLGKFLVRKFPNGDIKYYTITETEAYRGMEDLACHASKGRTRRTEIMFGESGRIYVYLIYGMYWLLNIVTNGVDFPAAVLIRGVQDISGPGRLGRELELDKTFYGESVIDSNRIWIEDHKIEVNFRQTKRIGVDYAGEWANKEWRYVSDT